MDRVWMYRQLGGIAFMAAAVASCSISTDGLPSGDDAVEKEGGTAAADSGPPDSVMDAATGAERPVDGSLQKLDAADDAPLPDAGAKRANGEACLNNDACASRFCADGVCCEFLCAGLCQSCVMSRTGQPDGLCRPIPAGMDPQSECPDEGATSCKRDGTCDGLGACRLYPLNTACGPPACSGSTYTPTRRCSGGGACQDAPPNRPCADALKCENNVACKTKCASASDCVAGHFCDAGVCKVPQPNGRACNAALKGADCTSGHCADGICCDDACQSGCYACTRAKTGQPDGKCASIPAGTDPDNECAAEEVSACGRDGTCDGAGACRKHPDGTMCGSVCCNRGERRCARQCNDGRCSPTNMVVETCEGCCCPNGDNAQAVCRARLMCLSNCGD